MTNSPHRAPAPALSVVAWVLVIAVVVFYTVGKAHVQVGDLWNSAIQARREIRLVPLDEFRDPTVGYGPWVNLIGNIALFLPVGFLAGTAPRGCGRRGGEPCHRDHPVHFRLGLLGCR